MRIFRLRLVMRFARLLRVPIEVQGAFFNFGKKDFNTSTCLTAPK